MSFISIEDCGRGLECPIHYRVQDHLTNGLISLIDYVGEYAVHTSEVDISDALWAFRNCEKIFDFHVKVYHVGENGTLAELAADEEKFMLGLVRNDGYHLFGMDPEMTDDQSGNQILEQIMAVHEATIGLVRSGIIAI